MRAGFFYIVVEIGEHRYFIDKGMDYTDNFENVMEFLLRDDAASFITKHGLERKRPKILEMIPAHNP